eukprot:354711_1
MLSCSYFFVLSLSVFISFQNVFGGAREYSVFRDLNTTEQINKYLTKNRVSFRLYITAAQRYQEIMMLPGQNQCNELQLFDLLLSQPPQSSIWNQMTEDLLTDFFEPLSLITRNPGQFLSKMRRIYATSSNVQQPIGTEITAIRLLLSLFEKCIQIRDMKIAEELFYHLWTFPKEIIETRPLLKQLIISYTFQGNYRKISEWLSSQMQSQEFTKIGFKDYVIAKMVDTLTTIAKTHRRIDKVDEFVGHLLDDLKVKNASLMILKIGDKTLVERDRKIKNLEAIKMMIDQNQIQELIDYYVDSNEPDALLVDSLFNTIRDNEQEIKILMKKVMNSILMRNQMKVRLQYQKLQTFMNVIIFGVQCEQFTNLISCLMNDLIERKALLIVVMIIELFEDWNKKLTYQFEGVVCELPNDWDQIKLNYYLDYYFENNNQFGRKALTGLLSHAIGNDEATDFVIDTLWNYIWNKNKLSFGDKLEKMKLLITSLFLIENTGNLNSWNNLIFPMLCKFCETGLGIRHVITLTFGSVRQLSEKVRIENNTDLFERLHYALKASSKTLTEADPKRWGNGGEISPSDAHEDWKKYVRLDIMSTVDLYHRRGTVHSRIMSKIDDWSNVFFDSEKCVYDLLGFDMRSTNYLLGYLINYGGKQRLDLKKSCNIIMDDQQRELLGQYEKIT